MDLPSYFKDFLTNIRISNEQIDELKNAHTLLRDSLLKYENIKDNIITTFLQGSYKRSTIIKPLKDEKADVDIVVVTKFHNEDYTPKEVLKEFALFLEEFYSGQYRYQGRSIGIELDDIELDLVPTSAPSEAIKRIFNNNFYIQNENISDYINENNTLNFSLASPNEPLLIPDTDTDVWEKTDPMKQIKWTIDKNNKTNGHYINVVKALKWWKKNEPELKYPKSYPLEHFIGFCCPDGINSIAEGIVLVLEEIINKHEEKPFLPDHGVPGHDVFARLTDEDYKNFYEHISAIYKIAKEACDSENVLESANKWREIFGDEFPSPPDNGFTARNKPSTEIPKGRFA